MRLSERKRRILRVLLALLVAPVSWLVVAAALTPLPPDLVRTPQAGSVGVRVLDRDGRLIRQLRAADGVRALPVHLSELPPAVPNALIAAEDARFRYHPGIDPIAIARATGQLLLHRRIVSGASTITQQLARTAFDRPRTLGGKLREMALAVRIDWSLDKDRILEEYLSRVEFGPGLRGIEAASRHYFDKPASSLGLAEAATLVAMVRGPVLYDPERGTERVRRRRDRILERMVDAGLATRDEAERAKAEPVRLQPRFAEGGAEHLVSAISQGKLEPELSRQGVLSSVRTTLDSRLQHEVETLTYETVRRMKEHDASAAAVLVVDNASGEVLAYVGSPSFFDDAAEGQNDGTHALRQPGSTLKPFLYAAAMERRGMTAATLLADVELHLATPAGDYAPNNYDGRFHGPVRLREALASSLNVPAVATAADIGPERVLSMLRGFGLDSLDASAEHYGAAIALGDGEVRLADLARAYSALARGGVLVPLRYVSRATFADGRSVQLQKRDERRVVRPETAALLSDVLSDPHARAAAFGRGNALELPFAVAAKTGTSKGYRDNLTVGFTHEVTVAVWVGNFDGSPMVHTSGVTGAGPLFHDVMVAAMRGREPAPLVDGEGLVDVTVCPLSGMLPGPNCPHRHHERFVRGTEPHESCSFHVRRWVDRSDGLLSAGSCAGAEERVFESYPARFLPWARAAGRPLAPTNASPRCPAAKPVESDVAVAYPYAGARFVLDGGLTSRAQAIVLSARVSSERSTVRFVVDGRSLAVVGAPYRTVWPLTRGEHSVRVETLDGRRSEPVSFVVD
ncbi:MAG: penicillin-binding protein 1C [Myxococcales bacterium]|nr:penicillin-binding protein 1C [Myxococcales bacterium]MCB9577943.1 penicillin-binding protein 1C [Polyangiaceae bacterium]